MTGPLGIVPSREHLGLAVAAARAELKLHALPPSENRVRLLAGICLVRQRLATTTPAAEALGYDYPNQFAPSQWRKNLITSGMVHRVRAQLPAGEPRPRKTPPPPRPARAPRLERNEPRVADAGAVSRIRPVSERTLRFVGWFQRAHWPLEEIALVFDVDAQALKAALRGEAVHG